MRRRRAQDDTQAAIKRRKLTESSHLKVSNDQLDSTIIIYDQQKKNDLSKDTYELSNSETSTTSRKTGKKSMTAGKSQPGKGKCSKKGDTTAKKSMSAKSPISKVASPANNNNDLSPSVTVERSTKMVALLTNPDTSGTKSTAKFFPQERQEMVSELCKLSKRELAQPTRYESAKVNRGKTASSSEEEEGGVRTPKLKEFGAFKFESPTKNEANKQGM